MMNRLSETLKALSSALNGLGIAYVIGGSVASSVQGVVRATFDLDLVAAIDVRQAERLSKDLGKDWYADSEMMRQAIEGRRAFNLIHIPVGNKIDIFPATSDFHLSQLQRAKMLSIPFLQCTTYPVATAEDILLAKLQW